MRYLLTVYLACLTLIASSQFYDIDTLQWSGPQDNRINLVILGDGYQQDELDKFSADAMDFTDALFAESPYKEYQSYFNVLIIKVPSNESGASHPGTASDVDEPLTPVKTVDNFFGSTFDQFDIHRLLIATNSQNINSTLLLNVPWYDQVMILVNSPYYGGSGGLYPVSSTHQDAAEIAIHELGHSFVSLIDEYYAGDVFAAEGANMTKETEPNLVKWKNWLQFNGIGIYKHCCGGQSSNWYRPHENCKMRYLGTPFCAVCQEATIETIHDLVASVESYEPMSGAPLEEQDTFNFSLDVLAPTPNTIRIEWMLNGELVGKNISNYSLAYEDLPAGANQVAVRVEDTTQLLRVDNHEAIHFTEVEWQINSITTSIEKVEEREYEFMIYPNPTSDYLIIDIDEKMQGAYTVELLDELGRSMIRKDVPTSSVMTQLNLESLPSGNYILELVQNKKLLLTRNVSKI